MFFVSVDSSEIDEGYLERDLALQAAQYQGKARSKDTFFNTNY